jgi:hypothetical protein
MISRTYWDVEEHRLLTQSAQSPSTEGTEERESTGPSV